MTNDQIAAIIEKAAADLGEYVDAVQILVSYQTDDGATRCIKRGCGNWYARQAMCSEFIQEDISEDSARRIAEKIAPPPDDEWKQS